MEGIYIFSINSPIIILEIRMYNQNIIKYMARYNLCNFICNVSTTVDWSSKKIQFQYSLYTFLILHPAQYLVHILNNINFNFPYNINSLAHNRCTVFCHYSNIILTHSLCNYCNLINQVQYNLYNLSSKIHILKIRYSKIFKLSCIHHNYFIHYLKTCHLCI